jgi:hypothetical protein
MEMKKVLAGWSKICPGCNIGRKYPDSFIGKKVRDHWEKGCSSHDAYVEVYGSNEHSSTDHKAKPDKKIIRRQKNEGQRNRRKWIRLSVVNAPCAALIIPIWTNR